MANDIAAQPSTVAFWDIAPKSGVTLPGEVQDNLFAPWEVCALGGIALPGIAKVRASKSSRHDVKRQKGQGEATITYVGEDPAEVQISLILWRQSHLNTLQSLMPTLMKRVAAPLTATQQQQLAQGNGEENLIPQAALAIDIYHPSLVLMGVKSVLIRRVSNLETTGQPGVFKMEIHCIEFRRPKKVDVTSTAQGSADWNTVPHAVGSGVAQAPAAPSQNPPDISPNDLPGLLPGPPYTP